MSAPKDSEVLQWVEGCRKGNRRAQHKLFRHFYPVMYRLCMRYASSTDEADDMLNEGFLKVFSNLDKYKEDAGSFESWMKRVMVHAAIDYRRKYDPKVDMADLADWSESGAIGYDENVAVGKMSADELVAMIQKLPPMTRTVFNLFVFENCSHAEIAQQMGITEGTSAWHVNAARTRLKNEIEKWNEL